MRVLFPFLIILFLTPAVSRLSAGPLPCLPGTLTSYLALGTEGCTVNHLLFSHFLVTHNLILSSGFEATNDAILVQPIAPVDGLPGHGLRFSVANVLWIDDKVHDPNSVTILDPIWVAYSDSIWASAIEYSVTILDPLVHFHVANVSVEGDAIGRGWHRLEEDVLPLAPPEPDGPIQTMVAHSPEPPDFHPLLRNRIDHTDPLPVDKNRLLVRTTIYVEGGPSRDDIAWISAFDQRFSTTAPIPEPTTVGLVSGALLVAGLLRRR